MYIITIIITIAKRNFFFLKNHNNVSVLVLIFKSKTYVRVKDPLEVVGRNSYQKETANVFGSS